MRKIILISLWCLGGMAAKAQIPQPDPDTTARHFLIVASIGNLQEVSAGQLAVQKAMRTDVKTFARMMVMDHQQSETKLLLLAKAKGISLPKAATGGIQHDLALKDATAAFDRLYVHGMAVAHSNTVEMFENYAINGKDPIVKVFAEQMLPALKHHLEEIERIDAQIRYTAK
jgi:putative membrane protein